MIKVCCAEFQHSHEIAKLIGSPPGNLGHRSGLWRVSPSAEESLDQRASTYSLEDFASARTHDPLRNATQRQLVREGRIDNYLRMLWGKRILEWTRSPREALDVLIELNNHYALDGHDPNSSSGIFRRLER